MITILCSVYNAAAYLDKYLNSINQQTLQHFEVVFIDANSTDNSLKKIAEYKFRKDISVQIKSASTRIGIYEAWNEAIKLSTNEYVMNYNCDDTIYPTSLHTYAMYATLYPEKDVIYSDAFISSDANHTRSSWYGWADANVMDNLLRGCCVGPFPLLKKSTIVEAGMFNPEFTISGDYEMWCRLTSLGKSYLKIQEIIGVYFHNPEGASTSNDDERKAVHIGQDNKIREMYS